MLWEELQVGTNADATQNVDSSKNDHPILAQLQPTSSPPRGDHLITVAALGLDARYSNASERKQA